MPIQCDNLVCVRFRWQFAIYRLSWVYHNPKYLLAAHSSICLACSTILVCFLRKSLSLSNRTWHSRQSICKFRGSVWYSGYNERGRTWLKSLPYLPHIAHLFGKLLFIFASSEFIRACLLLIFFILCQWRESNPTALRACAHTYRHSLIMALAESTLIIKKLWLKRGHP